MKQSYFCTSLDAIVRVLEDFGVGSLQAFFTGGLDVVRSVLQL